ncbi:MAG: ATP-binding protein [Candidatus Nanoarchaeia archaeon]|nr:ATP-binding protein [Candidatus Nanoarchaeia archaeon]
MTYEIPQQLQHKEKILFGLTFGQLAWASLFGTITLLILISKNTLTNKFILATIPTILGILFVFFDISTWIKRIYHFLNFRSAKINDKKMKDIVQIKKIQDNIIQTKTDVAILQITPLNFSIKTEQEKETIIIGFQKFLNSLDFPIQFVVTTHNLNMDSYLEKLESNVSNKELFNDFSEFMKSNIKKNQMRNRHFFLIIPKTTNLKIQADVCKERLESIGLKTRRIHNKEILNNLKLFFNDIGDEREMNEEAKDGTHYLIAPNHIKNNGDHLEINNKLCRIITASGYPRIVQSGFLDKIISSNEDFDISIHIEPFSIESMMIMLNKELQKQRADLYSEELKRSLNPTLEIKYQDTRKVLEEMQKGNEKLFNVSLYINCKGKTKEELDFLTKKVESELNSIMIVPNTPVFRQISAYKSMIPVANDELKVTRNITTKALSAFFPFTSPFLTLEEKGVMLGLNKNKVPYVKDIYALSNANGVILATSGSGKSYFTKLLISRQLLNNTKVMVIDPQSEYIGLTQQVKGQLITISRTSKTIINPLDLMGHEYIEKRLALMDVFKIMFGELSEIQKSILDKALTKTYAKCGITANSYKNKKPPILGDLYKELISMDRKSSQSEKITYRALINRLYMYTEGVFSFMNKQSKIDFNNNFVCFNIGNMPKQVKPVIMFLILDFVYMKMKETKERKLLVVDEAWSLLGQTEEAGYIFEIVKTCRKFNLGLLLITQDVEDLINSKAGHAVLANSSYSFLLRQKPAIINSVVKNFDLSQMEKDYLLTATQGKGILILDNEHQELEVVASPKEHAIITTNPNESELEEINDDDDREEIRIDLDLDEGLFYGRDLDIEQKNYLANANYKPANFVPLGKIKQEEVWVKENKIESLAHTFLVQNIKQELLKKTKDVEVYLTEKPDILFKNKKGELIAIEVETGLHFKKHKDRLIHKFAEAKREYKNLYIVLTDAHVKYKYESITEKIPILIRPEVLDFIDCQTSTKKK